MITKIASNNTKASFTGRLFDQDNREVKAFDLLSELEGKNLMNSKFRLKD